MPKKPKVLLIEDNSINAELVRDVVKYNFTVLVATTGEAGYQLALSSAPDLILCDIYMPFSDAEPNGHVTVRTLRDDPRTNTIPIIALTAIASLEVPKGFNGAIGKPIDVATFADEIKKYLPG